MNFGENPGFISYNLRKYFIWEITVPLPCPIFRKKSFKNRNYGQSMKILSITFYFFRFDFLNKLVINYNNLIKIQF